MNELKDAKEIFDKIPIPEELDQVVTNLIDGYPVKERLTPKINHRKRTVSIIRNTMATAAGVIICLTIALNSNEAFANTAGNLPVIGGIAKVLTLRSYQIAEGNNNISVNIPQIVIDDNINKQEITDNETLDQVEGGSNSKDTGTENLPLVSDINDEITVIVNTYLADAEARMQSDKIAFISTGGTEEEWATRDLNINVDYEVKYQHDNLLSFILSTDENWYGAYDLMYFYNLDLTKNRVLTLKDVLGEDYVTIANESIVYQMKQRADQDSNIVYWGITDNDESGIDGFKTVNEDTKFYMNEEGKPVICFQKYEIAPGFMGVQEFVID
jgi:hypothetical protein